MVYRKIASLIILCLLAIETKAQPGVSVPGNAAPRYSFNSDLYRYYGRSFHLLMDKDSALLMFAPVFYKDTVASSGNNITIPTISGTSILSVVRSGITYAPSATSTPGDGEYYLSAGNLKFSSNFISGGEKIQVLYKQTSGTPISAIASNSSLSAWTYSSSYALTSITRNSDNAIIAATVVWPDGGTGTFTSDVLSTAFPGATDAYHITYIPPGGGSTKTITQSLLTRNADGAVIAQPALTIL